MVELKNISKCFSSNGIKALDGANFNLHKGEIHILLGENGAGKSTLMHIMAGFIKPGGEGFNGNPGVILVNEKEHRFSSPAHSLAAGIGMVRQHPNHIPGFLVWENCITGYKKNPSLFINRRLHRKQVSDLNRQLRFNLPLDSPVETLSVSQSQKAAILTLLLRNTQYLIFDEPTAVLSSVETKELFSLLLELKDSGRGIVLISHKLEEALSIAGRVTVLRQGKTQVCCKPFEISDKELYKLIFGIHSNDFIPLSDNIALEASITAPPEKNAVAGPCMVLENFKVNTPGHPLIRGINLKIERGKIAGIAGLRDSGLETMELAITGFLPFNGKLYLDKTELSGEEKNKVKRIKRFRSAGACYLGKKIEGRLLPIRDILLIHAHRHFQKSGILNRTKINSWVSSVMEAAKVPNRKGASAAAFSGGQLQRLLLTREMAERSVLMVLSEPGSGLDLRYRKRLASLLREKAAENTAVLIFSTDAEELINLADSIAVLRDGLIINTIELKNESNKQKVIENIQEAMVGKA